MQLAAIAAASDDVSMVRDSIAPLLGNEPLRRARGLRFGTPAFDPAFHAGLASQGYLSVLVPESQGGLGLGLPSFCAASIELGRALAPEPFIASAVAAPLLPPQLRERVTSGADTVAIAWQSAADDLDHAGGVAADGHLIDGTRRWVRGARDATLLFVTVGEQCFVVEKGAPGVVLTTSPQPDGDSISDVTFDRASATLVDTPADELMRSATLGVASYQTGLAAATLEQTIEYLKVRKQFGVAIGSFQAIKHKLVDLYVQVALAGASIEDAALAPTDAKVSKAKVRASETAMLVTRQAIQLHGAIGVTDEFDIGLYLRKAIVLNAHFGSLAAHRRRFARLRTESAA